MSFVEPCFDMWFLPPLLLILVALHHRWRIRHLGQSSWKGGSFAMFSEVWRNLEVTELWVETPEGPVTLRIGDQAQNNRRKTASAIPSKNHLLAWARWVVAQEWLRCGAWVHLPFLNQGGEKLTLLKVTVRIRYFDFNAVTGIYSAKETGIVAVDRNGVELQVEP